MKKFVVFFKDGQSVTIEAEHRRVDDYYIYFYNGEYRTQQCDAVAFFVPGNIAGVAESVAILE